MEKRPLLVTLTVSLLVVAVCAVYLGTGARPQLGLDLQGGISAVYTPELPEGEERPDDFEEILDETISIIRSRVDQAGVAEPEIARQGTNVMVQLPGVQEADRVQDLIGRTAQLTFRPVLEILQPGTDAYEQGPDCTAPIDEREQPARDEEAIVCGSPEDGAGTGDDADAEGGQAQVLKYRVGPVRLTGDAIEDAYPATNEQGGGGYVTALEFGDEGGETFAELTGELACNPQGDPRRSMAIVVDGVVETASPMSPEIQCDVGITGGSAVINMGTGSVGEQQQRAEDLALVLRTGALPITLEEATFQTVSPTLGSESLRSGLIAGIIGLALVGLWLIGFYRWLGLVALGGLAIFGVVMLALISFLGESIGFALTLAGVAGIIVSVGITADSSIIFFERIRDEVNLGKTVRTSIKRAFDSAFRTNLAGNTVTLAAAAILYFLAVGPVRGFALMLGMATVLDVIILYFVTRPTVMLMGDKRLVTRRTVRARETAKAEAGAATAGGAR